MTHHTMLGVSTRKSITQMSTVSVFHSTGAVFILSSPILF